ncbi:hypothetical protein [uncultured Brachyspira sp.]|uniref:hypothetical protein n=1 Tax=uncultured Brachyspira sp. TaxID=221953 RepID=UPI0027DC3A79|nr:hypothetical protein [uncultured Brachyspira sp.]
MARVFDSNIKDIKDNLEEAEALVLEINKKPLSEDDINHYARVFGFDSDEYTKEEKRLLAMYRILYWHYN